MNQRALVVGSGMVIWASAAGVVGYMIVGWVSPPGLGTGDWALLALGVILVAGLPFAIRSALRRDGRAAPLLAALGVGFALLMGVLLILVVGAGGTGIWPIVFAGLTASGAGLTLGAISLTRAAQDGP